MQVGLDDFCLDINYFMKNLLFSVILCNLLMLIDIREMATVKDQI